MVRWLWGGLLVLAMGAAVCAAQVPGPTASPGIAAQPRVATVTAISVESERKLHAAFEHLYNLEFDAARHLFEEVAAAEPQSATVHAFWASALLYEILAYQGTLQSQLFVTTNEFLRFQRLPPDTELERRFQETNQQARELARRRLKENREDIDGLFAAGLSHGNEANYLAGVKAEYFRGLRQGEKAFDYHQRLRELRPELHDTAVVLGVRNYVIGSLPRATRFLLFFIGARGNRARGLEYLEEAARGGEFLRTYAQILLAVAWIREEQIDRSLPLVESLRDRFPRNPIFMLELAKLYHRQERYPQAAQTCRDLLAELIAHPHNPRVMGPEDALLELGQVEAAQGQYERALESLRQVEKVAEVNERVLSEALLERGKLLDRLGRRQQAQQEYEYEKVIRLNASPEYTRLAQSYLDEPYQADRKD